MELDAERLIGSILKGALSGRRKRSHRVQRMLTGRGGLLNGKTLLALAGVAWGLYETATQQGSGAASGPGSAAPSAGPPPPPSSDAAPRGGPPASTAAASQPPPLDDVRKAAPSQAAGVTPPQVPEGLLRVVRLTVSAARADGTLSEVERESILAHARAAGVEPIVAREIDHPVPLPQIVAGVTDPAARADLYTLAFAIVRADEQATGGERVYLAQLAHLLGLDPETTSRLEQEAAAKIDAEG